MSAHRRGFKFHLSHLEHEMIANAAKAHGCLPRDLIVRAVAAYAPAAVVAVERDVQRELSNLAKVATAEPHELTPRELEVLTLMAQGLSNKLIGVALDVTEHTAKFHVNRLMKKLRANTRTAVVVEAVQRGWLSLARPTSIGAS